MSVFGFACQKALKSALLATAQCGGRIYDGASAPQDVQFPWIEIGDRQVIPDDSTGPTDGSDSGVSDFFDLHVWSRDYAGKKQVEDIIDALHGALHGASMTIPGRASALAWVRNIRVLGDPDGKTCHGVITLEIIHRS